MSRQGHGDDVAVTKGILDGGNGRDRSIFLCPGGIHPWASQPMSEVVRRHSGKVRVLPHLTVAVLAVLMAYSLQRQAVSSVDNRVVEAGLIESGGRPALYFDLRNTGENYASYTYIVTCNATAAEPKIYRDNVTVAPGRTFGYSISLIRPSHGVMSLNLKIYRGGDGIDDVLLHNQTWIVRAQI